MVLLFIFLGMQSQLWPQLQASCLPPRSLSINFRFSAALVLITVSSVPCKWFVIVQKSQEVFFNTESFRFSKSGFHMTTKLMSSSKSQSEASYLKFKNVIIRNHRNCSLLGDLGGPELAESAFGIDTTRHSNFYFFKSTCFICFPSKCQSRYLYNWSKLFISEHLKIWSLHRKWNPDRPQVTNVILVQTYLEISTRPLDSYGC